MLIADQSVAGTILVHLVDENKRGFLRCDIYSFPSGKFFEKYFVLFVY